MKSIQENIAVDARNRVPRRLRWDGRTYRVRRLLDYWILQTRWWGREEKRIYFRLETNRGVVEVYRAAESLLPGLSPAEWLPNSATPTNHPQPPIHDGPSTLDPRPSTPASSTLDSRPSTSGSSTLDPRPPTSASSTLDPRPPTLPNPLPIEGDTHTRERRRTDAAYRPDVRIEEHLRRKAREENLRRKSRAADRDRPERVRWVLSKIID